MDAGIVADAQPGRVDKADARTLTHLGVQVGDQRHEQAGHQLDKALVAHLLGKLAAQVALDVLRIIRFEGAVMGLLEQDQDRHHLAGMHLCGSHSLELACRKQCALPFGRELQPEIVYGTKQFEYTH